MAIQHAVGDIRLSTFDARSIVIVLFMDQAKLENGNGMCVGTDCNDASFRVYCKSPCGFSNVALKERFDIGEQTSATLRLRLPFDS
jgi:hypothetical protein